MHKPSIERLTITIILAFSLLELFYMPFHVIHVLVCDLLELAYL